MQTANIDLGEFQRYLMRNGWSRRAHPNSRIQVFATPAGDSGDFESVVVPASLDFADSQEIISRAVRIAAEHENEPVSQFLNKIRTQVSDSLKARFFSMHRPNEDHLPLDVASEAISLIKEFIGYAAYTTSNPKPFFDKAGNVSAEFTKHCQFGHTFAGSFGLTIDSPLNLPQQIEMAEVKTEVPFERQVFDRVGMGLLILSQSIEKDSLDPMLRGYHEGFNANMCRTLAEIYEKADGRRIEYDLAWSVKLPSKVGSRWKPFTFEGRAHEISREAARELERVEKIPDSVIKGRIVMLKSEMPPGDEDQGEFERLITMFWEREKDQSVKIRVPLTPDQYVEACDAHKNGQQILIMGIPEKHGKIWTLTKPHEFQILPR